MRRRHKQYSCLAARKESYPFKLSTAYSKCSVGVVLTANYYQCIHNGTDPSQLVSTRGHHKASLRLMNECLETRTVAQTDRRAVKLMTLFHTRHSSIRRVVVTPRVCKVGGKLRSTSHILALPHMLVVQSSNKKHGICVYNIMHWTSNTLRLQHYTLNVKCLKHNTLNINTVHRDKFLIINQLDAPFSQIYLVMKLYMFRSVPLSIIRSFSLYTQKWYMSYGFADSLRASCQRTCMISAWLEIVW